MRARLTGGVTIDQIDALAPLRPGADYLGRPIAGSAVTLPTTIEISKGRLVWSEEATVSAVKPEGILDAFLALADDQGTHDDVLAFARRFGPLWLCQQHSLVSYHRPLAMALYPLGLTASADELLAFDTAALFCHPRVERKKLRRYSEPIAQWRRLASQARDLLQIAAGLRQLSTLIRDPIRAEKDIAEYVEGKREKWKALDGLDLDDPAYKPPSPWSYLTGPWERLAENLNRWIQISDLMLVIEATGRNISPRLTSNRWCWSVLGLIALQIVAAVAGASGLANCSNCALPYLMRRPPTRGTRHYCDTCRNKGVPVRDAQRDRSRKKPNEKEEHQHET